MIRRKEDIRVREVQNAQKGKGTVTFYDWLLPEEAMNLGRLFSKVVLPPGASIGRHQHNGDFEAFYVAEGEGLVYEGDELVPIHAGDMNLCRDGEFHGVENTGDKDLVLMATILFTK